MSEICIIGSKMREVGDVLRVSRVSRVSNRTSPSVFTAILDGFRVDSTCKGTFLRNVVVLISVGDCTIPTMLKHQRHVYAPLTLLYQYGAISSSCLIFSHPKNLSARLPYLSSPPITCPSGSRLTQEPVLAMTA